MERFHNAGKMLATREACLWAEPKAKHVQVRLVFKLSKKGLNSRFSGLILITGPRRTRDDSPMN